METSVMTTKGQILVPVKIRRKFGMKKGTKIIFVQNDEGIMLQPMTKEYFDKYAGLFNDDGNELDVLMAERKKDRVKGK